LHHHDQDSPDQKLILAGTVLLLFDHKTLGKQNIVGF